MPVSATPRRQLGIRQGSMFSAKRATLRTTTPAASQVAIQRPMAKWVTMPAAPMMKSQSCSDASRGNRTTPFVNAGT
jgi:hypothetical protein